MTEEKSVLEKIDEVLIKLNKRTKAVLIIGGLAVLVSPFLFTHFSIIDFSGTDTAAIGATIGGITAPVVGLVSALLIYFSFLAQIKANQIQLIAIEQQQNNFNIEHNENRKDKIRERYDSLFFQVVESWKEYNNSVSKSRETVSERGVNVITFSDSFDLDVQTTFLNFLNEVIYFTSQIIKGLQTDEFKGIVLQDVQSRYYSYSHNNFIKAVKEVKWQTEEAKKESHFSEHNLSLCVDLSENYIDLYNEWVNILGLESENKETDDELARKNILNG